MSKEVKILSFVFFDFDLSLNIQSGEENMVNQDDIGDEKQLIRILNDPELVDRININSRNFISTMSIFINKTSKNPNIIDIISFNTLSSEKAVSYPLMQQKIKNFLEEDLNSVIDSGLSNSNDIQLKLISEDQSIKTLEFDFFLKLKDEGIELNDVDEVENEHNQKNFELYKQKKSIDHLYSIPYEYNDLDYLFIDLNLILELSENLSIQDFFNYIRTKVNPSTFLITFFPKIHLINKGNVHILMYFLSISDITVYEINELYSFSKLIGIESDEKNNEIRFLKEIKKIKKKSNKIGIFFDNFYSKLSIIIQDETNMVLYHKDFEYGLRKDNEDLIYQTVISNKDYFKGIFFGGFFSKIVKQKSYEIAFEAGMIILKKMFKVSIIPSPVKLEKSYFIVLVSTKRKKKNLKKEILKMKEENFVLDCINSQSSKLKEYKPLYDDHLSSYFSNDNVVKVLKKKGFINKKGFILDDPDSKSINNKILKENNKIKKTSQPENEKLMNAYQEENKKLLMIKENNEKMLMKMNHLFSQTGGINDKDINQINKLPKLKNIKKISEMKIKLNPTDVNPFTKTSSNFSKQGEFKKRNLNASHNSNSQIKPIDKNNYDKLLSMYEEKAYLYLKNNEHHL